MNKCHTCTHERRSVIDAALLRGESASVLGRRFGISKNALNDHRKYHLSGTLKAAQLRATVGREDGLLSSFSELVNDARRLQRKAEAKKDYPTALLAIKELTRLLELAVAPQPKPAQPKQRVRLQFMSGKINTIVEPADSPVVDVAFEPTGQAPPAKAGEPRSHEERPSPPTDEARADDRAEPQAPELPDPGRERWLTERRREEQADAAEDQANGDARLGIGKEKWGLF